MTEHKDNKEFLYLNIFLHIFRNFVVLNFRHNKWLVINYFLYL